MSVKHIFYIFLAITALVSCNGREAEKLDQGTLAVNTAKLYYQDLISGKTERFLEGVNMPDHIPEGYRKQMLTNYKQFMERQKKEHRGIDSIAISNAQFSEKDSTASVFLILHFADSTSEQIVVPMLKRKGIWYMR